MTERRLAFVEPWTADRVMARLKEAATSLRTAEGAAGPSQRVTWWPDFVRERQEAYGYTAVAGRAARVSSEQIARLDLTLAWISSYLSKPACAAAKLPEDAGWVVWARAAGWSYAQVGKARKSAWGGGETRGGGPSLTIPWGNARPSLVKIEAAALGHVATMLNRTGEQVDREARMARPGPVAPPPRIVPAVQGIRTIAPARGEGQVADKPLVSKVVPVARAKA